MSSPVFKTGQDATKGTPSFECTFKAGEYLFKEGELGTEMFIIQSGSVEIVKELESGPTVLAVLDKGDFFGEMALLEDLPRTASARAVSETRLLQFNGSTFDQMLRSNPEIAVRMMRKLSHRLRRTDDLLKQLSLRLSHGALEASTPDTSSTEESDAALEKFVHIDTEIEFPVSSSSETLVGRRDAVTGINPDVDLTEVDTQRSTSRRHAKLFRRGDRFFVTEEIGVTNGTFVAGERLETGVPGEVKVGQDVQFGLVKMRFVRS